MPLPAALLALGLTEEAAAGIAATVGFAGRAEMVGGSMTNRLLMEAALEKAIDPSLNTIVVPVNSTAIRLIAYHPSDHNISVEFMRGGTYEYEGSMALFIAFALAPSKGQFFNEHFQVKR